MNTPIFDFVQSYLESEPIRMHMPGHKGMGKLGIEQADITEIDGADVLYHESGILRESQENASKLFGSAKTLYSTEGATLCIRAMLALVKFYAREKGSEPVIFAGRNAHKSFITGCALLDLDPIWIQNECSSLLSCNLTADDLESFFKTQSKSATAVYLTSPDYLGNVVDIKSIAAVCHKYGAMLLVDNAHGAYLHFLPDPAHPLDLGADIVCDSAHKTLPVLTGGAYLHISKKAPQVLMNYAQTSMSFFSSTSPSYLILQSLDLCNAYLNRDYSQKLYESASKIHDLKKELKRIGFQIVGNEPLKITVLSKPYGYLGTELAELLKKERIFVEFSDPDFVVLMLTPEQNLMHQRIIDAFSKIIRKNPILIFPPRISNGSKLHSPGAAMFSPNETVPISKSCGRILAQPGVTCPPAIPIAVCGERITDEHVKAFQYYGIQEVSVLK